MRFEHATQWLARHGTRAPVLVQCHDIVMVPNCKVVGKLVQTTVTHQCPSWVRGLLKHSVCQRHCLPGSALSAWIGIVVGCNWC